MVYSIENRYKNIGNIMRGTQNQFNCFVVGEGTLPIQCAELLLDRGHQVFGGNSLLGTQIISSVRQVFQVKLPLMSLFETPTLADMSQAIIRHQEKPGIAEKIAMVMQKIKNMSVNEVTEMIQKKKKAKIKS